jgi:NAD(P)-dependent dehydrogenase (short-subunit alcohol dehydrogenase family)
MTGRMKLIGRAGARRYARIAIDAELPRPHFVAALAHELQHVSELIAHRHVEDQAAMADLYRRIGREYRAGGRAAFETEAARRMGVDVLVEMLGPRQLESRTTTLQFARGARER